MARPQNQRLRHRPGVHRIVAMEVVSGLGDGVFWVALAALLFERGVGADGFAVAALMRLGPRALLSAPAGLLADRLNRRVLLPGLDGSRAVLMISLAIGARRGSPLWLLFAMVLASYTLAAPYRPAVAAALPSLSDEAQLSAANALVGTVRQIMTFVGPVLGALVLNVWSPAVAFAVNGVSFVVAALLMASIRDLSAGRRRLTGRRRTGWLGELRSGRDNIVSTAGLGILSGLVFVMYLARGAEPVLYVLVSHQRLNLGAGGIGVLSAAVGLGAICALPCSARIAERYVPANVLVIALASTAIPVALLGITTSLPATCALLVVVGAGVVVFEVLSVVLLQRMASPQNLGRIFGFTSSASNAGKLCGALAAPALVELVGLRGALYCTGAVVGTAGVAAIPRLVTLSRQTHVRRQQLRPVVDVLAALSVFDGASHQALERLAASVQEQRLDPGVVVISEGDPAEDLFIVRRGDLEVSNGHHVVSHMRAGDYFGEIGLLQNRPRTATVKTSTQAELWRIPGGTFLDAVQSMSAEPSALFEVLADRLERSARVSQ